jgi:hypothetical protein
MDLDKSYESIKSDLEYQLEYLEASESLEKMKEKCMHHLKRSVLFMNMIVTNQGILNSDDELSELGVDIIHLYNKIQSNLDGVFLNPIENDNLDDIDNINMEEASDFDINQHKVV